MRGIDDIAPCSVLLLFKLHDHHYFIQPHLLVLLSKLVMKSWTVSAYSASIANFSASSFVVSIGCSLCSYIDDGLVSGLPELAYVYDSSFEVGMS